MMSLRFMLTWPYVWPSMEIVFDTYQSHDGQFSTVTYMRVSMFTAIAQRKQTSPHPNLGSATPLISQWRCRQRFPPALPSHHPRPLPPHGGNDAALPAAAGTVPRPQSSSATSPDNASNATQQNATQRIDRDRAVRRTWRGAATRAAATWPDVNAAIVNRRSIYVSCRSPRARPRAVGGVVGIVAVIVVVIVVIAVVGRGARLTTASSSGAALSSSRPC